MLELLAKNHELWLRMVLSFGCPSDVAEDLVHEMYLKLHRLIEDEQKITVKKKIGCLIVVYYKLVKLKNFLYIYTIWNKDTKILKY